MDFGIHWPNGQIVHNCDSYQVFYSPWADVAVVVEMLVGEWVPLNSLMMTLDWQVVLGSFVLGDDVSVHFVEPEMRQQDFPFSSEFLAVAVPPRFQVD